MTKYYEALCSNHDDMIDQPWVKHIFDTTGDNKIRVKHCKKQGQRMENRLHKYRRAVERLGFKKEV